jgi:hypothetical protein
MATGVAQMFQSIFKIDPEAMMKHIMEGAMSAMNMRPEDIKNTVDGFQTSMSGIDKSLMEISTRLDAIEQRLNGGEDHDRRGHRSEANGTRSPGV